MNNTKTDIFILVFIVPTVMIFLYSVLVPCRAAGSLWKSITK